MAGERPAEDLHVLAEERLRGNGQRYPASRRAVLELLVAAGRPLSIADICEGLPGLPLSSAYRHLTALQAARVISRVAVGDEFARFELADDLTEHHHHLQCVTCAQVIDITLPAGVERDVARAICWLAGRSGFQAHSYRLGMLGVCARCATSAPLSG